MITVAMKKRLYALEISKNINKELSWDCKNLFEHYFMMLDHHKASKMTDNRQKEPFRFAVEEDQRGLSPEAQEFISLSVEGQALAVEHYRLIMSTEKVTEMKRNILEKLNASTQSIGLQL